ncbi:MAG: Glutamyl-Q tRNA(Asp) synthetase, partial [Pseudomonadota bacterium]
LPVAVNVLGEKLSKQTLAAPIEVAAPVPALNAVLQFLGQPAVTDCAADDTVAFWAQAVAAWDIRRIPHTRTQAAPD